MDEHELSLRRAAREDFYRNDPRSPLAPDARRTFAGLRHFPLNPELRFSFTVEPFERTEFIELDTSDGARRTFARWAEVQFEVEGVPARLTIFADPGTDELFLPFQDALAGYETYGAGRYLDLDRRADNLVELDFNLAYNPYCAYSDDYSCPLPPAENRLKVPIRAGEMTYHP